MAHSMCHDYRGAGDRAVTNFRVFWNDAEPERGQTTTSPRRIYSDIQSAITNRPPNSTIMTANVYGNVGGRNRFLGAATYHVKDLLTSGALVKRKVTRPGRSRHDNGELTIKNFKINPWPAAHMAQPVGNMIDEVMSHGGAIRFDSVVEHDEHFKKFPEVVNSTYAYFKTPLFVFGQTMVPYAAFPGLLKPEKPSPISFYRKSLDVAKQRLNVSGNVMYQSDANKTRLLSGMVTAYSVSTPYSLETDPAKVGRPAEYFAPMRLRGFGDCEDVSWEVLTNFKEFSDLDTGNDLELQMLQKHAKNYTAMMMLGSAMSASAGGNTGTSSARVAHMFTGLVPNDTLASLGLPIGASSSERAPGLRFAMAEGTGNVEPLQYSDTFPTQATRAGLALTDRMVKTDKVTGVRRPIYDPPSNRNNYIIAGYYDRVVSAYASDPNLGLVEFRDADGKLGARLSDIMNGTGASYSVRAATIPGTIPSKWQKKEKGVVGALLGLHEPIMPLNDGNGDEMPLNSIVPFLRTRMAPPPGAPTAAYDTNVLLPYQEIGYPAEQSLLKWLKSIQHDVEWATYNKQEVGGGGVGSLQINLKLKA